MESLSSLPLSAAVDQPLESMLARDNQLRVINADIISQQARIANQAALVAQLEADGHCTIVAEAQMGAMEQWLNALLLRRQLLVNAVSSSL